MPISLSAKRSQRKSEKNRKVNAAAKQKNLKTVKEFLAKPSAEGLKKVYASLDGMVKRGIFHRNKAARLKSKLAKKA